MKVARFALILYLSASSEGFQGQRLFGARRPVHLELSAKKKSSEKKKQALIFGSKVTLNEATKPFEVDIVKDETKSDKSARTLAEEEELQATNDVANQISLEKETAKLTAEEETDVNKSMIDEICDSITKGEEETGEDLSEDKTSKIAAATLSVDADAEGKQRKLLSYRLRLETAQTEVARVAAEEEKARIAAEEEATRIAAEEEAARIAAEEEAARIVAEEAAAVILASKKEMEAKQRALLNRRLSRDKVVFEKRFAYAEKLRARQAAVEEARSGTPESVAKYSALVEAQESLADKCFTVLCALGMHDEDDDVPDPDSEDYVIIHGHVDEKPWNQISTKSDFFWEVPPEMYLEY